MGTLTVYFVGLCTHLREWSSGVAPHRVVLVNAGRDRLVNGHLVRKHQAWLRLGPNDDNPLPLDGVTIKVNAAASKVDYDKSFDTCIPHLPSFAGSGLPPLSAHMTAAGNPDLVAAYFDARGVLSAGRNDKGAAIAILKVATIGNPSITLVPFGGKPRDPIVLKEIATIQVENVDSGQAVDHDFLLHYKLFVHVPRDVDWPKETGGCAAIKDPALSGPGITVGPGCSNSNYP